MKSIKTKTILVALSIAIVLSVFTFKTNAARTNLVTDSTTIVGSNETTYDNSVFKITNTASNYLARFTTPGLRNQYTWTGNVKITGFTTDKVSDGVRFCIGYNKETDEFLNLIVTKSIGISAEKRGPSPESDIYPLSKDVFTDVLSVGYEFSFKIQKQAEYVRFIINDKTVIETALPEKYDFFTSDYDANLGFFSEGCSFEVSNVNVYNEDAFLFPETSLLNFELLTGQLARGLYDGWYIEWPTGKPDADSKVEDYLGSKQMKIKGYAQFVYAYALSDEYSFSADLLGTTLNQNVGLFVRSSKERFLTNNGNAPHAEYFEADSNGSIAGTGIYLKPLHENNKVRLYIKQYDPSKTKKISSVFADLDISSILGSDTLITKAGTFRFVDNGSDVKLYLNDTMIAVVEFSSETVTYPSFETIYKKPSKENYVKTAVIKNANGDTLVTAENTLIAADYSTIGFATRSSAVLYLDNLNIDIEMDVLPPEPTTEPLTEPETTPSTEPNTNTSDSATLLPYAILTVSVLALVVIYMTKKRFINN